ncbi:hypothetical protein B0T18DRAFT_40726 [Schizothecium vesticola]|uniref:Uncharacterized protein n=1 Tax=Schizothecium vesticola TaxID=314040 RepID=A0AA40FBA4_9PEZI|nr:hypothetical protein B0T18DRAFT_40726 [Schizothecium vesticola]
MASIPNFIRLHSRKVPLSAPSATRPPTPLQLAAYGARRNGVVVCRPSFVVLLILCLSSRRSPTQGTRTEKAKGGSTKLQLLPARPDSMEGVGWRRRRGQLKKGMVISILAKSGLDSTALRRPWPTRRGFKSPFEAIDNPGSPQRHRRRQTTPHCHLVAQTSSFPLFAILLPTPKRPRPICNPHHPTIEIIRKVSFSHLLATRFSGSAGYVRAAAVFRHASWTGLRGCKVRAIQKRERHRSIRSQLGKGPWGRGKIQEQKRTPLLPATTAAFHCPSSKQHSQQPLLEHCRFRVAPAQKADPASPREQSQPVPPIPADHLPPSAGHNYCRLPRAARPPPAPPPPTAMSLASATPAQAAQSIPRLSEPLDSDAGTPGDSTPRATTDSEEKKKKKRSLFGFGKQKEEPSQSPSRSVPSKDTVAARRGNNASPVHTDTPRSPGRSGYASTSPRLASPAGSQIFERDVQESTTTLPNSPAIPSHIQTENYIPPVLDASSEAITDGHLDPDNVEIITHTSHQPAAVNVTGSGGAHLEPTWADELAAFASDRTAADSASNYGSFDTTDVRRLSFISFADVVQAEQQHGSGSRDSMHMAGLTSLALTSNRSPSPIRSPVSSTGAGGFGTSSSPPTSKSGSVKGLEVSPARKPLGSPTTTGLHPPHHGGLGGPNSPTVSGEISIETMTQALRRTGSGDLSVPRNSVPTSPI